MKYTKMILLGVLSWLVPFVVSIPFFTKDGKLMVDPRLFKSVMVVTGAVSGAVLLSILFRKLKKHLLREGIVTGVAWFAINWILDIAVLVKLLKMPFNEWAIGIGLGYLAIPAMSIAIGYVAGRKRQ